MEVTELVEVLVILLGVPTANVTLPLLLNVPPVNPFPAVTPLVRLPVNPLTDIDPLKDNTLVEVFSILNV